MARIFDPEIWAAVPFHFWSVIFFAFGSIVGSFLNVCIYRMPLELSVIAPPSHCPHCKYSIPWYLNIPLFTWLFLGGKCANCRAPISSRYFFVELLTGLAFLACWLAVGRTSVWLALAYCLVLAGFIVATFIDFEHFIIPDEITIGGMVAGAVCSFAVPALHGTDSHAVALFRSFVGMAVGAGVVYAVVRIGKLLFGRQQIELPENTRIIFTETGVVLPDREVPFEELFYRKTDVVTMEAKTVELIDRCYARTTVRLMQEKLFIGDDEMDPEPIKQMEVVADRIVLPREAMGFGDVKFMGAIGAFLGWKAAAFSLMVSSILGAIVGLILIVLRKQEWSSRLPYGPYIAVAAVIWMFAGPALVDRWIQFIGQLGPGGG
ncbi:MAG TPA: prepilin peptidase [Verrucomicrobiae bacterium]|nr:prepilin peptidase [Verrucomicrobiae bacterium]